MRTWLYRLVCEVAWPVFMQERHRLETAAIRGYQRELAFRAWYRRYLDAINGWWRGCHRMATRCTSIASLTRMDAAARFGVSCLTRTAPALFR
ncbi:hypothetical protein [Amycolatopsis jejuensis]|uniref:hypothetical protein n=1 Tax=Amycolatopsis jejuensis TaxID=330084 RepID=UPI00068E907B|nr:hypothetical protein [Amycolatopsis jejuensis]